MRRPTMTLRCVADRHSAPRERIAEFNANDGSGRGGLISLRVLDDGRFVVDIYRCDAEVIVRTPEHAGGAPTADGRDVSA